MQTFPGYRIPKKKTMVIFKERELWLHLSFFKCNIIEWPTSNLDFVWVNIECLCQNYISGKTASYLQYLSVNASILTILAISFERLFVICVPLKARKYCTKRRTINVIGCIWVLCSMSGFPVFMYTFIYEAYDNNTGTNITACYTPTEGHEWYLIFEIVVFYICPGVMLLVIYALIIKSLRSYPLGDTFQANNNSRKITGRRESRRQLIILLLAVVIAYFICLLPFNAIVVIAVVAPEKLTNMNEVNYTIMLSITRVLFFVNSCINPILYNAISCKFRIAFLRFFGCTRFVRRKDSECTSLMKSSMKLNATRRSTVSEI